MKYSITFLLSLMTLTSVWAGGPWPQPKGKGYFKLFEYWVVADQHFTDAGMIDPNITTAFYSTGVYGEYGLTDRLTAVAYVPFFVRNLYNNAISGTTGEVIIPGEAVNAFGDVDLSLTYGLVRDKPIVMSASVLFGLPTGVTGRGGLGILQTGDGEFNQMIKVDAGGSFQLAGINFYASAYAGFNNRTQGFSDEFRYGFETGGTFLNNKLTAIARFTGIESFQNGSVLSASDGVSLFANNAEYLAFSPEIAYHINEQWGVSASSSTVFFGRLIMASPAYSVGVFFTL
ncbi:hypothetical protein [Algivirga pacifica]|uniref:MetA-pathway of phenol degradation n=1 Tax=Algivirga pacifica TaxID=1162670 RepID=A0ABP9D6D5_9BACT